MRLIEPVVGPRGEDTDHDSEQDVAVANAVPAGLRPLQSFITSKFSRVNAPVSGDRVRSDEVDQRGETNKACQRCRATVVFRKPVSNSDGEDDTKVVKNCTTGLEQQVTEHNGVVPTD